MEVCADDRRLMLRALELAARGLGHVEPNPPVGCVVVSDGQVVGEGWHRKFGGPHAEVEALAAAGKSASGCTLYVTLEPCCHQGKTPPCTDGLIAAGVKRVVIGCGDPNPRVAGGGIAALRSAGIQVDCDVLAEEAGELIGPFAKLLTEGRPWTIAKWAMTLDGKLASRTGSSQWITSEASRAVVHRLRGRMDAILIGRGTAEADDPLLTARPQGPRTATRVVLDSQASLSPESRLVGSLQQAPLLIVASESAPEKKCRRLRELGVEVLQLPGERAARLDETLRELGRREITNLLVEGGSDVLGALLDADAIDEVHAFIGPKLIGGSTAPSAFAGAGIQQMCDATRLHGVALEVLDGDLYVRGLVR